MKPHNVLGQCFLNILVLSCDLEPIRFEEGFENVLERERAARRTVQSRFAPDTSNTSGEAAKAYSHTCAVAHS